MLLWGAKHGHTQFVRRMLREFNIDVNVRSHKSEASPLHLASAQGHYETVPPPSHAPSSFSRADSIPPQVELLLSHGADVNAKTSYGRTPLERAARFGHAAIVQLLLFRFVLFILIILILVRCFPLISIIFFIVIEGPT